MLGQLYAALSYGMVPFCVEEENMAKIVWDEGWEEKVDHEVSKFMKRIADEVLDDMRAGCPVDTGELLADLDAEVNGKEARIGAKSVPYAIYVEEGVGPHVIRPNDKEALHWAGAAHPVNEVHHPGMEGTHFMKHALYIARTE